MVESVDIPINECRLVFQQKLNIDDVAEIWDVRRTAKTNNWADFGCITHMLHGAGIYTYIYPKNHPNVGKYSSTMEHLGNGLKSKSPRNWRIAQPIPKWQVVSP